MVSERCVSITEIGSIGRKPSRRASAASASGIQIAFMPNAGSRISSPGVEGRRPSPTTTSMSWTRSSCVADDRAVQADLIGLGRRVDLVGKPDFRHDEAVFARELAPHLGDAVGDLGVLRQQRRGQLLGEAQLDLDRLQLLLDRGARLGARCAPPAPRAPPPRPARPCAPRAGIAKPTNASRPPSAANGNSGRPGMTPRMNISAAAMNSAVG